MIPGFEPSQPTAIEVALRLLFQFVFAGVFEFFVLWPVLLLLRHPMDLTFPATAQFIRSMLLVAAAMAGLMLIPWAGWLLALAAVVALTIKLFDGSALSGAYVALAMYGADKLIGFVVLSRLYSSR